MKIVSSLTHRLYFFCVTKDILEKKKNCKGFSSIQWWEWMYLDHIHFQSMDKTNKQTKISSSIRVWNNMGVSKWWQNFPFWVNYDFECDMVVGARWVGLSISETTDLLGFSHTTISRVCREWCEKEKISSERQFCGWTCLVDARDKRRMARLVWAERQQ